MVLCSFSPPLTRGILLLASSKTDSCYSSKFINKKRWLVNREVVSLVLLKLKVVQWKSWSDCDDWYVTVRNGSIRHCRMNLVQYCSNASILLSASTSWIEESDIARTSAVRALQHNRSCVASCGVVGLRKENVILVYPTVKINPSCTFTEQLTEGETIFLAWSGVQNGWGIWATRNSEGETVTLRIWWKFVLMFWITPTAPAQPNYK